MNVGTKWTHEEDLQVIKYVSDDKSINYIANEHQRSPWGIKCRLLHIAVRMIETEGKSIEEVCTMLHVKSTEIDDHKRRNATKSKGKHKTVKIETELDVLKDIRELLIRIEISIIRKLPKY